MKAHLDIMRFFLATLLVAMTVSVFACAGDDDDDSSSDDDSGDDYNPNIDPANFTDSTTIDNPYLTWTPGTTWFYTEDSEDGPQDVVVKVTHDTKVIMGITCVVVHDSVSLDGDLIEDTLDYYAQDNDGTVWYMGEDTAEYEDGEIVSTEGSFAAGEDGALPGIVMEADPKVGDVYRQEYYAGEAEDTAEIVSLDESVTVPFGTFDHCLQTHEWNPLEPDSDEFKYHCPDVGNVVLAMTADGSEREELTDITTE